MAKRQLLCGHPVDADACERYYRETHKPLAAANLKRVRRIETERVVGAPGGGESPFYRIAALYYDSAEDLQAGMESLPGQAVAADWANFATGGASLLISNVD